MAEDSVLLCSQCNKNVKEIPNNEFYESCSSTQIPVVKLKHTWTITNFSLCCQENGEKLVSPTFYAESDSGKLEWCLSIYPKGEEKNSDDDVVLYLILIKGNKDGIQAKFKCGFVNAKGEKVKIVDTINTFNSENCWGYLDYFQRCLFKLELINEYLVDDKLTIFCEIIAGVGSRNFSGTLATPQSDLRFDFTFLLENEYLNDVILFADGKEFPAHKAILSAQSPVFRAMFQHDMEESRNNRVKITDIDKAGLGEMLRYMYTGKINKLEEMAPRLLCVAGKYELDDLKIICEQALLKILSLENVAEIFILSDKFSAIELKTQVKKFIAAHGALLGNSPEFKSIFRTHPDLALEAFCALIDNTSSSS